MHVQNILITGRIYKELQNILEQKNINKCFRFLAEDEISYADFQWADAYVGFRPTAGFEFGNIKWVHSLGAGVDGFLQNRDWKNDVLLTRTICSFGSKISEYCLSHILRNLQNHHLLQQNQSIKKWEPIEPKQLNSQKIVIYGTGEIGQEVARALSCFGVTPYGVSLSGEAKSHFFKVFAVLEAEEVLKRADWIISTLPLTKETHGLFDVRFFEQVKGASFINVGRGATIDESALLEALHKGNIHHAVLDVFSEEPLSGESLLWEHSNIIVTPHISAITSPEEAVECFLHTLEKIEGDMPLSNRVNIARGY
ncbi:D-2-hydroxyacid dehydrogenase [Bacillus sp. 165]|uniref:D-2-hydroxyacid dehydrogenase n=1 Tax=Bacillus sp. 165 TaxID=1529117 RepID=UPI001ADB8128|nr:D-2-hydroxyacid dehydrogenase [Bacillus sp. 165]